MQGKLDELKAAGVSVVAISYDSPATLKAFAASKKIEFTLLSDDGSPTIKAWHLLNKEAPAAIAGVPYPGTFIVDKTGTVRAKLFHDGYLKRHTAADVLKTVASLRK